MTDRRVLFSVVRNEKKFLLEWLAYYKIIGFTHIILYSNGCTDDTNTLLDQLSNAGELEHHRHFPPPEIHPQDHGASCAVQSGVFQNGDWVFWADPDEFLCIHIGDQKVDDLIGYVAPNDAMIIAWRIFGDGGQPEWLGHQLRSEYMYAEQQTEDKKHWAKTLFRWGSDIGSFHPHGPVLTQGAAGTYQSLTSRGDKTSTRPWAKRTAGHFRLEGSDIWNIAQINHHAVRSAVEYDAKRERHREGDQVLYGRSKYNRKYWRRFNKNDVLDDRILVHRDAVLAETARLMRLLS